MNTETTRTAAQIGDEVVIVPPQRSAAFLPMMPRGEVVKVNRKTVKVRWVGGNANTIAMEMLWTRSHVEEMGLQF